MNTLSSLTSRSVRVFFQTPDTAKGVPESIDSGRRNAIKAGLTSLLVVATATSAVSALAGEVDKGAGQVVETPFGKLSFAQIQKHEKKDEILDDIMTPAQSKAYIAWEKGKTQVAIEEGVRLEKEALAKMRTIVAGGGRLKKEYEPLVLKYATTPPPDKNALYIQEEAKKRQIFA